MSKPSAVQPTRRNEARNRQKQKDSSYCYAEDYLSERDNSSRNRNNRQRRRNSNRELYYEQPDPRKPENDVRTTAIRLMNFINTINQRFVSYYHLPKLASQIQPNKVQELGDDREERHSRIIKPKKKISKPPKPLPAQKKLRRQKKLENPEPKEVIPEIIPQMEAEEDNQEGIDQEISFNQDHNINFESDIPFCSNLKISLYLHCRENYDQVDTNAASVPGGQNSLQKILQEEEE